MRLDIYLQQYYPDISRAQLQRLIKNGKVSVSGEVVTKNSYSLDEDDAVAVDLSTREAESEAKIEPEILYEDVDCVVINKPVGALSHSKGAFNPEDTVATWLTRRPDFSFPEEDDNLRIGIVHRLDRSTSGVMIAAKNPKSQKHLQKQFQNRKAKKGYTARVEHVVKPEKALMDLPIERNPKEPQRFRVGQNGKPAQTAYRVLKIIEGRKGRDTLIELNPLTGRTHQLRVHMNYIKHPIVGDTFYGGRPADRLFLHAQYLGITLPNNERKTFTAPVPKNFYTKDI